MNKEALAHGRAVAPKTNKQTNKQTIRCDNDIEKGFRESSHVHVD
jgi:hypothetical protein